ncbi:hypothetical protein TNCV_4930631 [Trichonephila clavipes]|nr:hypothetical protein TNCV_4930631 [Trichonephila clavipes]
MTNTREDRYTLSSTLQNRTTTSRTINQEKGMFTIRPVSPRTVIFPHIWGEDATSHGNGPQQAEVVVYFSPSHPCPMEIPCVILTA